MTGRIKTFHIIWLVINLGCNEYHLVVEKLLKRQKSVLLGNINFRVLASGSLPRNMTFRRNNVGLETLGFFPCIAQVQPMPNSVLSR